MKKVVFILLLSICCSEKELPIEINWHEDIDVNAIQYFDSFKWEAEKRGIILDRAIQIRFKEMKGLAGTYHMGSDSVSINSGHDKEDYSLAIERIVFHELGHAYLGYMYEYTHVNREKHGIHIMNEGSDFAPVDYYIEHRTELLNELFNQHPELN